MAGNDNNRIEELQKEIYERKWQDKQVSPEQHFSQRDFDVDKKWTHEGAPVEDFSLEPKQTAGSFFRKIFIFSVIFFLVSAGLLLFVIFGGWNITASDKVDIQFLGPVSVSAGSELDFDIILKNQNSLPIENAVLYIDYPESTKNAGDITKDFIHETQNLGEIVSGATIRQTSRSVIFGELNSKQDIKIKLEYNLQGSKSNSTKEKTYTVVVSSTPLTIQVSHPDQAVSGDSISFVADITSNSSVPLQNLLLKAEYPFGFSYTDANPKPDKESGYWFIPKLDPGESVRVTVNGQLQGEQNDERVFRFSIGTQSATDERTIATKYLSQVESVFIQKPLLGLVLSLEGKTTTQFTTEQGAIIHGSIYVTNNMSIPISDAEISLVLSGKLFDPSRVSGNSGFYRSVDNTVIWNKTTSSQLVKLDPGDSVNLTFTFATLKPSTIKLQNGTMSIAVNALGRQASNTGDVKTISSSQKATILTQTSIGLISRAVYSTGPFTNRGPIPPKADNKTTYTIIWTATNSLNDARGTEVRATLPTNVTWLGATSPQSESISWNPDKSEVVWNIGDLTATAGGNKSPREVAFQVELLPSLNQVGNPATLVISPTITAVDSFTNTNLSVITKDLTTSLPTDPRFSGEEVRVIK